MLFCVFYNGIINYPRASGGRWAITVVVIAALQIQEADYTYVLKIKSSVTVALSLLIECDTHIEAPYHMA